MVEASGALRAAAVGFVKIANDVRWLGSGPRAGLGELRLPELQAGSSIMPAKVNPVMCEMLLMVSARVIGADQIVAACAASGNFELNVSMPLMGYELCFAIQILSRAVTLFADRCIAGLEVDEARCRELAEGSLALATALVPRIGYDRAAELARAAADRGTTVRAIAVERAVLPLSELDALLDPRRMTEPD
jgi:fumarate hydratase class II